ncbi:MAG: hypothetical protein M5U14_20100 [Acidimicrobiia bacterium]|nr:hypothetical protein [Acidimicrobiia bacterium]
MDASRVILLQLRSASRRGASSWREVFDAIERRVGPRLEQLVRTEGFADTLAFVTRLEARARRGTERRLSRYWHLWNLPAATDVRRLSERVALVERRVKELSDRLEPPG